MIAASLIALAAASYGLVMFVYQDKVLPRVSFAGRSMSGLTGDQASALANQMLQDFQSQELTARFLDQSWRLPIGQLKPSVEPREFSNQIISYGRSGSLTESLWRLISLLTFGRDSASGIEFDQERLDQFIAQIAKELDKPEADASIVVRQDSLEISPARSGERIDSNALIFEIRRRIERLSSEPIEVVRRSFDPSIYEEGLVEAKAQVEQLLDRTISLDAPTQTFKIERKELVPWLAYEPTRRKSETGRGFMAKVSVDRAKLTGYVKTLSKQIDRPFQDAKLKIEAGRASVFKPSVDGLALDQAATVDLIAGAILGDQNQLVLPIKVIKPRVTTATVNDLGINEVVGSASTNFKNSPNNRVHNIVTGAESLNGLLIAPGETFSVIESLGEIDASSGYLPELVIKNNATVPEFGGGLCQVSTTLFRAVLNSGLPIVERQNHSWRISYYEPPVGLDATIFLPKPDLKFKNDTPGWLLIQSEVKDSVISFTFFGTKDGRRSEISSRLISSTPAPEPVYTETDTLKKGEQKQVEKPHPGGKAIASYKVFDRSGKMVIDQIFNSSYKPVPARFLIGTAEVDPAPADQPSE